MENLMHKNEKKVLEEKENSEEAETESLRITNKYLKKVIHLFIYDFYLGKRNNDE